MPVHVMHTYCRTRRAEVEQFTAISGECTTARDFDSVPYVGPVRREGYLMHSSVDSIEI